MDTELPRRKRPHLKDYDYSSEGAYFVTICVQNRKKLLSRVVGRGLAPAEIEYTKVGQIAKRQLLLLEERYSFLKIEKYVIMPDHIHAIIIFDEKTAGASPRPTLFDVICAYKSLTTRECKKIYPIDKLFQTSFVEHIIRNQEDYNDRARYIEENPLRWLMKKHSAENNKNL
ncbi:MAG: transposase [Clostridia bacterium]|nr:transposase [Clostridia bacterium]